MIKAGVIGLGKWGLNHVKTFKKIRCKLVGISDVDLKKKDLAMEYGTEFFYDHHKF